MNVTVLLESGLPYNDNDIVSQARSGCNECNVTAIPYYHNGSMETRDGCGAVDIILAFRSIGHGFESGHRLFPLILTTS